jgi:hypothetical protein
MIGCRLVERNVKHTEERNRKRREKKERTEREKRERESLEIAYWVHCTHYVNEEEKNQR